MSSSPRPGQPSIRGRGSSLVIAWKCAAFGELSALEVHDILQARAAVFVVEQACAFQDVDGVDPQCWHLLGLGPRRPGDDEHIAAWFRPG
jgi:ElaA protein